MRVATVAAQFVQGFSVRQKSRARLRAFAVLLNIQFPSASGKLDLWEPQRAGQEVPHPDPACTGYFGLPVCLFVHANSSARRDVYILPMRSLRFASLNRKPSGVFPPHAGRASFFCALRCALAAFYIGLALALSRMSRLTRYRECAKVHQIDTILGSADFFEMQEKSSSFASITGC